MLKFVHIPKTGGTSIEHIGMQHNLLWGKFDIEHLSKCDPKCQTFPYHCPLHEFNRNPYNCDTFSIVRHPFSRTISLYVYITKMYKIENRLASKLLAILIGNTPTVTGLNNFIRFVMFAKNLISLITLFYCVLRPQHEFIYKPNGEKQVTHVLKLENLESEFSSLMSNYHFPITLTEHKYNTNSASLFTHEDITQSNKQLLYQYYEKDFELFGYDP